MLNNQALVPPPEIVREQLAKNVREGEVLRELLRLSEKNAKYELANKFYGARAVESAARRVTQ